MVRRAFSEFLLLPSVIVVGFLVLAIITDVLDRSSAHWVRVVHDVLGNYVFGKPSGTNNVLGAIAGGVITMTSITVTVLLVALQQSSSNLTPQVFDQFLRRRANQAFFGYFVGLAVYTLVVLASIDAPFNPIFGATVTLLATVGALLMMIAMLYSMITQMRPVEIIAAIHDHILDARHAQRDRIAATRRRPRRTGPAFEVISPHSGFVTELDITALAAVAGEHGAELEVTIPIGTFISRGDTVGLWRGPRAPSEAEVGAVQDAIIVEGRRSITRDPAYGIEQLQTIGWSAVSSAKQNQEAALLCIRELRDVLAHWAHSGALDAHDTEEEVAVVYHDDVVEQVFDALEALAIGASESLQHQSFAAVIDSLASVYARLPVAERQRADDMLARLLSGMGEQVLSQRLERAIENVERVLREEGAPDTAGLIEHARADLALSIGHLGSRSTRAEPHGRG